MWARGPPETFVLCTFHIATERTNGAPGECKGWGKPREHGRAARSPAAARRAVPAWDVPIPVEVAELTAEWFGEVLPWSVRRVEVLEAHSGTTGRARVALDGDGDEPATLFVKLAPFDERQRAFVRAAGLGTSEARFYETVGDELALRVPRVWHTGIDAEGRFVMVLEDLVASGCTFPRPRDPDVADHARGTIDGLAALHAPYWESDRFDRDLAWVPERAGFGSGGGKDAAAIDGAGRFVRKALDVFGDEMPPAFAAVGSLYADHTAEVLDLWDEGERTLIHGDPHMGNLFLDGSTVGFLDWAMTSRSPGMRDVAYFCCNSLPREVRREAESELLDRYLAGLAARGVTMPRGLAEEQYRLFSVFSWVSSVSTAAVGSRWQPAPRALAAMERTTQAIDDLDAAGLLAQRLGVAS